MGQCRGGHGDQAQHGPQGLGDVEGEREKKKYQRKGFLPITVEWLTTTRMPQPGETQGRNEPRRGGSCSRMASVDAKAWCMAPNTDALNILLIPYKCRSVYCIIGITDCCFPCHNKVKGVALHLFLD